VRGAHHGRGSSSSEALQERDRRRTGPRGAPEDRRKDDHVRSVLRDRSRHQDAPERLFPKGRFPTREETIRAFDERRRANLDFVRTTSDALRDWFAPHPFAGLIDGYQWILFLAAHTDRHAEQIEEIKGTPGFPRSA